MRHQPVRRLLQTALALFVVAGGLVVANAGGAATQGTLDVTPSTRLKAGMTVALAGAGWAPNAAVGWCLGIPSVGPPSEAYCDAATIVTANADENGNFSARLVVKRYLNITATGARVDCAAPNAKCIVGAADQSDIAGTGIVVPISFAPVPRTIFPMTGSVVEGNTGTTTVKVAVRLSRPQSTRVSARWTTRYVPGLSGPQAVPDVDYTPASGSVSFAPGQTNKTVSISVNGDTTVEPNEPFAVAFSRPVNATIGGYGGLGFATIVNDDA
jgi:hypothetical protein